MKRYGKIIGCYFCLIYDPEMRNVDVLDPQYSEGIYTHVGRIRLRGESTPAHVTINDRAKTYMHADLLDLFRRLTADGADVDTLMDEYDND